MDNLQIFEEKKRQMKAAEILYKSIDQLKSKKKHTEILVSLLQKPGEIENEARIMLMLSMNTPETGRVDLDFDDAVSKGLVFGLNETIKLYDTMIRKSELEFDTIIAKN